MIILTIAYENIATKIPIRAHIKSLFASFIFAGSPLAVISFIHQKINTPIHIAHIENRKYILIVCIISNIVDSSVWIVVVSHTRFISPCPQLGGTSTTIAYVEKRVVNPIRVKIIPWKKFLIIVENREINIIVLKNLLL
jgi:hypothetical protein